MGVTFGACVLWWGICASVGRKAWVQSASSVEVATGLLCGRAARRTAACHNAAREVGVGKHHLHVVGHERAHETVRVANLMLRLVRLHHRHVSFATIGRCGGRAVLLPPCRGKLRLLFESSFYRLLFLTVRLYTPVVATLLGK